MSKANHRHQVVDYIFITKLQTVLYYLLTEEITSSLIWEFSQFPLKFSQGQWDPFWVKGSFYSYYPHSLAIIKQLFQTLWEVFPLYFCLNQSFINWASLSPHFPKPLHLNLKVGNPGFLRQFFPHLFNTLLSGYPFSPFFWIKLLNLGHRRGGTVKAIA